MWTGKRSTFSRALPGRPGMLLLATLPAWPSAAAAQTVAHQEEGIVEVVAERLAPLALVVLVDDAGSVLLPVEAIAEYLELPAVWSGTAFTVPTVGGGSARLDTATNVLTTAGHASQLAPAEVALHNGTLHLRTQRLAELLGAAIDVEFATLTVTIRRTTLFPAQQRIVAEQRRAVFLARQRQLERHDVLAAAPYPSVTGVGILDWQLTTGGIDPSRLTTVRTHLGAAVLGGDLGAGASFEVGRDAADHVRDVTLRYHRVFPRSPHLTQVSAGDIITSGLFGRFLRGIELSNRPFLRSAELSAVLVQPDLPQGWEYEVFQGNQLLGYSDIASSEPVSVPLRSGTTPVQVRMYGPAGEEVISTLLYQTPVSLLRRRAFEYSIAAGECAAACDEFAHADVRFGATSLITVGAGMEAFRDSAGLRGRPYVVYNMTTGLRATAELTLMPSHLYSANLAFFPRDPSRAGVRASIARPGLGPISLSTHDGMRWDIEATWDERIEPIGSRFSQLRFGAAASGASGQLERWRASTMASFTRGFLEARYDHDNITARAHLLSGRAAIHLPLTIRGHPFRPLLTTALGAGRDGVRLAEAGVSVQPRSNAVITAAAQWSRGNTQPALSIGYHARIGGVQSALRAVSSPAGNATSSLMLSGSTAVTHRGDITVHPAARTGYAGLHGRVFIDRDDDGLFSAGDEPVSDAHLIVGAFRTSTDDDGRFRVWGMHPYEPVPVALDSARTPDPTLTTRRAGMVVRPAPNVARRFDIPLVRTSELIGTLTAGSGVATVAGVSLDITDLESGAVTTTVTFSDGFYYVSRVRPGRYRITVSAPSLQALGASAVPASIEFTVSGAGEDPVVEVAPIELRLR